MGQAIDHAGAESGARPPARRGRRPLSVAHLQLKPAAPALGQTLQDAVYAQLRAALMVGAFRPGESLSARSLAAALGTSGMPVKDALRRLVAEGVLAVLPQSAFVVETLTAQRYLDLTEARVRLETFAAARAADRASPVLIRRLRGINHLNRLGATAGEPAPGELLRRNYDFHFAIYEAADMPDVCEVIMATWLRIGPLFSLVEADLDQAEDYERHGRIVDAVAARDVGATVAMLERDIRETAERIAPKLAR